MAKALKTIILYNIKLKFFIMKKFKLVFFLFILFLVIGAVSAIDDNTTDIVQAESEDAPISIDNSSQEISNDENDILTYTEDSSSSDNKLGISDDGKSKLNLTVATYSNFIKKGNSYSMYLTDLNGHGVVGKKVVITLDGKSYKKTTTTSGKFSIPIDLAKSYVLLNVSYNGDDDYNAFSKIIKVKIENSVSIDIGNSILLSNGYLRIYLHGPLKLIANKKIKIKIGNKVFTKRTDAEGNLVFKPKVSPKKYKVTVIFDDLKKSKIIKCIKGNAKNPFKKSIPTKNGVPDVDRMTKYFIMGYKNAKYTLKKSQYREVMKRDRCCLMLYGKLSKYVFFKTKPVSKVYHIIKRDKWNVIEREILTKVVKKNKYSYWPKKVTVSLSGKSYAYSEVRDIQNTGYTCGPTSGSVCSQVLKNFHSEKYFQIKGHVTSGINIPVLKKILENEGFSAQYFYYGSSYDNAVKQLKKGAALIVFLPNHYVSVIDVSKDGKKVLVSNSYGSYDVGCRNVPTDWVSLKYFKSKYGGVGLIVKNSFKISNKDKKQINHYYKSMGGKWNRQNVNERIPNIGL